ncbi:MAG TPA: NADH-quinone oxidoreductase subunit H [Candidatus Binatia bacterium]|nr:NADH-quinone oxidoreductase subunit H [Candidatus Binatia bacterium]
MESLLAGLLQAALAAAAAPLLTGVLRTLKARLVGRRGPSVLQPYADLRKLLGKEPVISPTTSWIFRVTPWLLASTSLVAALLVPLVFTRPTLVPAGNIILVMSLFMLATFFLALAGLDAGSAFGGLGASRSVALAALAEPTVILAVFALAIRAGTSDLGGIIERLAAEPAQAVAPGHLLALAAFFIVMLAETGRLPVDNPATHLELTMIHEAMVLEYSGHYLALVEWASAMKFLLFLALLANLFFPFGVPASLAPGPLILGVAALAAKLAGLVVALALIETAVAKLRLFRVPELLAGSFALGVVSVTSAFVLP